MHEIAQPHATINSARLNFNEQNFVDWNWVSQLIISIVIEYVAATDGIKCFGNTYFLIWYIFWKPQNKSPDLVSGPKFCYGIKKE